MQANQYNQSVPDFDYYPITAKIQSVSFDADFLTITWDDAVTSEYHIYMLRENAPDYETTHEVTRELMLNIKDLPDDLAIKQAQINDDGLLRIDWSWDKPTTYHPGWLRAYSNHEQNDFFALPPQIHWSGELDIKTLQIDASSLLEDTHAQLKWCEHIHTYGLAILQNLPADEETIRKIPELIGLIRRSNFGEIFNVQFKVDADSNAYTDLPLPLHIDLPTREIAPGIQFLHCIVNDSEGGYSIMADGFKILDHFKQAHPEEFALLCTEKIHFINKDKKKDYRMNMPIISLDEEGNYLDFRFNTWLRGPQSGDRATMKRVYQALRLLFAFVERDEFKISFPLKPGEMMCFDNRRVLHGRTGFSLKHGKRWLRGTYMEREELYSKIRILKRQLRAQNTSI